jgi:hypothetical protein
LVALYDDLDLDFRAIDGITGQDYVNDNELVVLPNYCVNETYGCPF